MPAWPGDHYISQTLLQGGLAAPTYYDDEGKLDTGIIKSPAGHHQLSLTLNTNTNTYFAIVFDAKMSYHCYQDKNENNYFTLIQLFGQLPPPSLAR
jgi:hypothetical protein